MHIFQLSQNKGGFFISRIAILLILVFVISVSRAISSGVPESFADLVEELSPAVVNITTTTLERGSQDFNPRIPPGSPLEDFFREF